MGVDLAEPSWHESADPDEVDEMLFPFLLLTGHFREAAKEAGESWLDEKAERKLLNEARATLADQVLGNRRYWFEKSTPDTVRREAPKVGRNDPCPCGSGKKHKQCCGK
jgi:uncharacterized protein